MFSPLHSPDYYFSMALWINSKGLEGYVHDVTIQQMVDVISWEDNTDELLKISDLCLPDLHGTLDDDQYIIGEAFAKYINELPIDVKNIYEFMINNRNGRIYFIGEFQEVFDRIQELY